VSESQFSWLGYDAEEAHHPGKACPLSFPSWFQNEGVKDGWKVKAWHLCVYGLSRGRQTDKPTWRWWLTGTDEMNIVHFTNLVYLFIILTQVDLFCYIFAGTYGRSFPYEVSKKLQESLRGQAFVHELCDRHQGKQLALVAKS
jgi:hypothetical protein